ncbi:predicted protein [Nematostella vectensis]|uniref:FERM domain-containing protein n=1 Tax=Nematostella vectensis TaxID=45351 RepID=A7S0K0_NEMVE|nr:predicted protein [Nematostella vectensis]|eukprot:XP_001634811.1 predicted protein [Nematostella vectensis]
MSHFSLLRRSRSQTPTASVLVDCQVVLLDNSEYTSRLTGDTEALTLFNGVCDHTDVPRDARRYFGLQYVDRNDGETNWLELHKPIYGQQKDKTLSVQFVVRVFPLNPLRMEPIVQRWILLQMKDLLSRGKVKVSLQKHALLDSYFAQATLGDYDTDKHGLGYLEDLLGSTFFGHPSGINSNIDVSETSYVQTVTMLHQSRKGMTAAEAIQAYLDLASSVPFYGVRAHRGATTEKGVRVVICLSLRSLQVYTQDEYDEPNELLQDYEWPLVDSITASKAKFYFSCATNENHKEQGTVCLRFHGHFGFQQADRVVLDALCYRNIAIEAVEKHPSRRQNWTKEDGVGAMRLERAMSAGRDRRQNPMASLRKQMRDSNGGHV